MHHDLIERDVLIKHIESAGLQRHIGDLLNIGQRIGVCPVCQQGDVSVCDLLIGLFQQLLCLIP